LVYLVINPVVAVGMWVTISGGDFDDAIDVIDVWLYVDSPAINTENSAGANILKTIFSH